MTDKKHGLYLLSGIQRNHDWQWFLGLMMDKIATATLTADEIVIKLVEKEGMIQCVKGLGQEAPLFTKGNAKGNGKGSGKHSKSGKAAECDEDQQCKAKLICLIVIWKGIRSRSVTAWNVVILPSHRKSLLLYPDMILLLLQGFWWQKSNATGWQILLEHWLHQRRVGSGIVLPPFTPGEIERSSQHILNSRWWLCGIYLTFKER